MKLLIITQKVDRTDTGALGFFHSWIEEFSKHTESLIVICLEKGEYKFSGNVKVLSLGKEEGKSRIKYLKNFYRYIWQERKNYDTVFVHMNQEYVLLAGWWWRMLGKKVLVWRNHKEGNWLTRLSVFISNVVFCTSPDSFTAQFKKTRLMPTGINLAKFKAERGLPRVLRSILSTGRISTVKNIDILIRALVILDQQGVDFTATIAGDADPDNNAYYRGLIKSASPLIDKRKIVFRKGIPNTDTPNLYQSHELFVNMTRSGSLDKTILSAMASGALVIVCNTYFRGVLPEELIFKEDNTDDLARKIKYTLAIPKEEKNKIIELMKKYVADNHGLEATVNGVLKAI